MRSLTASPHAQWTQAYSDMSIIRQNNILNRITLPILCVSAVICVGCGGSDLATVTGVVTLDGASINGGSVLFAPEVSGALAFGNISPDGSYELQSAGGEGLKPGAYIAVVSHRKGVPSPGMTIAQIQALEMVPIRYTVKETSDLHKQVAPGENKIDLALVTNAPK
jgi:hypothetical protein